MHLQKDIQKKEYEIGYLVKEEIDRQEIVKLMGSYKADITNEGKISNINLAYPIEKEKTANFGFLWFTVEPEIIKELTEKLRLNGKILRSLIITPPIKPRGKRPVIKPKETSKPVRPKKRIVAEEEQIMPKKEETFGIIDNELLEKKLEEILK